MTYSFQSYQGSILTRLGRRPIHKCFISILSRFNFNWCTSFIQCFEFKFQSYQGSILTLSNSASIYKSHISILSRFNFNRCFLHLSQLLYSISILSRFNFNLTAGTFLAGQIISILSRFNFNFQQLERI